VSQFRIEVCGNGILVWVKFDCPAELARGNFVLRMARIPEQCSYNNYKASQCIRNFMGAWHTTSGLGEGRQNIMTFPAEPRHKDIFINGRSQHVAGFRQAMLCVLVSLL
jgi:hypothetical protein